MNGTPNTQASSALRFDRTVPRQLAHRRALGEVFVADSVQAGEGEYLLAVQVPRAHSLWFDRRIHYHDPFSMVEAARQSAFVVVHRHLGVPVGLPFSLQRVEFRIDDLAAYRDDLQSPLEGVLRLHLSDPPKPDADLGSLSFEGELEIAGARAMTVSGGIVFLSENDYEALRAFQRRRKPLDSGAAEAHPVRALEPAQVGRFDERNVVIGDPREGAARELRFPLIVDRTHPAFFDHSFDHVPGPLLGEAFRQAALVAACRVGALGSPVAAVTACDAGFSDFGEFEAPIEISATVQPTREGGDVIVDMGVHQFGKQIALGTLELREYPSG